MLRKEKEQFVAELKKKFQEAECVFVTQPKGLNADENNDLRSKAFNAGVKFQIVKNKLMKIASEGTSFEELFKDLEGPTAVAFCADPVSGAKLLTEFANDNEDKFAVVSGAVGEAVYGLSDVEKLAKIPPMDELRAKIVAVISTPARNIATIMQAPQRDLATIISKKPEASA